jgi:hypothetical protein
VARSSAFKPLGGDGDDDDDDVATATMDDEKKSKMKWWERSVLVRTNLRRAQASSAARTDDDADGKVDSSGSASGRSAEGRAPVPISTAPGAVAVRGPGYRGEEDDEDGEVSTVRVGGGRQEDNGASEAPLHVDSYAVKEGPTDEEIRQRILANTAHAEAVTNIGSPKTRNLSTWVLLLVAVVVVVAVVVGVSVPLATRSQTTTLSAAGRDSVDLVASLKYLEWQGSGGFAEAIQAQNRQTSAANGTVTTSGALELIACRPRVCLESDESCAVGEFYAPGCCAGPECPNATKCGDMCTAPPDSCFLADPTNKTCIRSECYTCEKEEDGQDVYSLRDLFMRLTALRWGQPFDSRTGKCTSGPSSAVPWFSALPSRRTATLASTSAEPLGWGATTRMTMAACLGRTCPASILLWPSAAAGLPT